MTTAPLEAADIAITTPLSAQLPGFTFFRYREAGSRNRACHVRLECKQRADGIR